MSIDLVLRDRSDVVFIRHNLSLWYQGGPIRKSRVIVRNNDERLVMVLQKNFKLSVYLIRHFNC
jgi:hypothetical protein